MKKKHFDKTHLQELSTYMIHIHKFLTDELFEEIQRNREEIYHSGQRLNLLLSDPEFQWLRPLSQLISQIDETIYQKEPIVELQVQTLLNQTKDLLITHSTQKIYEKIHEAFDRSPDMIIYYAHVKKIISDIELIERKP